MTPVPGCSKEYTGGNFCINPKFEGALVNQPLNHEYGEEAHMSLQRKLRVCEGNCNQDSHCEEGLVCFEMNNIDPSPPGCTGTPNLDYGYCIYPQLDTHKVVEERLHIDGAFIKVGDDGIVKVFSNNDDALIWWSSIDPLRNETATFNPSSDISIHLAKELSYAGSYMHSSVYENIGEGGFHVNENLVEVHGSIYFSYKLLEPYHVTALSQISFNVTLGSGIEALALCIDDGLTPRIPKDGRAETTCLAIGGSSIDTVLQDPKTLPDLSDKVVYSLMELFPTRTTSQVKYIGIIQRTDSNGGSVASPSFFENFQLYEDGQGTQRRLTVIGNCPDGELAATTKAGLQDSKESEEDFCVQSEVILKQIELDEGELCKTDHECRSGLCDDEKCQSRVRMTSFLYT